MKRANLSAKSFLMTRAKIGTTLTTVYLKSTHGITPTVRSRSYNALVTRMLRGVVIVQCETTQIHVMILASVKPIANTRN